MNFVIMGCLFLLSFSALTPSKSELGKQNIIYVNEKTTIAPTNQNANQLNEKANTTQETRLETLLKEEKRLRAMINTTQETRLETFLKENKRSIEMIDRLIESLNKLPPGHQDEMSLVDELDKRIEELLSVLVEEKKITPKSGLTLKEFFDHFLLFASSFDIHLVKLEYLGNRILDSNGANKALKEKFDAHRKVLSQALGEHQELILKGGSYIISSHYSHEKKMKLMKAMNKEIHDKLDEHFKKFKLLYTPLK